MIKVIVVKYIIYDIFCSCYTSYEYIHGKLIWIISQQVVVINTSDKNLSYVPNLQTAYCKWVSFSMHV